MKASRSLSLCVGFVNDAGRVIKSLMVFELYLRGLVDAGGEDFLVGADIFAPSLGTIEEELLDFLLSSLVNG